MAWRIQPQPAAGQKRSVAAGGARRAWARREERFCRPYGIRRAQAAGRRCSGRVGEMDVRWHIEVET